MADGNKGNSAGHSYGRDSPHAQPHTGASSRPVLEQDAIGDDRLPGNDADIHAGKGPRPRPRPRLESLPCLVASFRRDSPAPIRASAPPLTFGAARSGPSAFLMYDVASAWVSFASSEFHTDFMPSGWKMCWARKSDRKS